MHANTKSIDDATIAQSNEKSMNQAFPPYFNPSAKAKIPKAKRKSKWRWKDHNQGEKGELGRQLIDWLRDNPQERILINFLTNAACLRS